MKTGAIALVEGLLVSGHIDLLVLLDGTVQDYKFTSAWTIAGAKREGKVEWERQLNVYRFLLENAVENSGLEGLPEIKQL